MKPDAPCRCAAALPLTCRLRFEALDATGKAQSGLVDADNSRAARSQLRAQALVPLAVTQVVSAGTGGAGFSFARRVFNPTGLAVWTRQLAGLVGSGLPLERALTALADEAEDTRQRELVAHLRSEVNAGRRSPARWRARRASSTTSIAASSPPASRAARSAACSSASPTTSRRARS
jgi:hypothetical protein